MDGDLQSNKSSVHFWEVAAYRDGEKLKQLESTIKEEGLFCIEWCVVMSVSMCTTLLMPYHVM